jgi:hypothetical protein
LNAAPFRTAALNFCVMTSTAIALSGCIGMGDERQIRANVAEAEGSSFLHSSIRHRQKA